MIITVLAGISSYQQCLAHAMFQPKLLEGTDGRFAFLCKNSGYVCTLFFVTSRNFYCSWYGVSIIGHHEGEGGENDCVLLERRRRHRRGQAV
jgi:hypothetical protein